MKPVKRLFILLLCCFLCCFSANTLAQFIGMTAGDNGSEYPGRVNDAAHPCITPLEYERIEKRITENRGMFNLIKDERKTTLTTTFNWPLQMANGLNDCGDYFIANYVDQDPTSGIKDYNCGTVTYDGHRGTDIATAPYPFYKMDNNQVDVIAAAPGTIIDKSDGYFDRNCAMSTDTANYIIIQHADGSCALYWHMKKFSLTSKIVGNTVTTGEFLGVVGSSGDATGPHLHFEVWANGSSSSLNDPYTGTCNLLNPATWWVTQKPYTEPAILKAQVNMLPVILPGCDTTETPNEDTCIAPGATAKLYIFIRNETPGMTANLSILNPDGTTFTSWVHNSTTSYLASYWYWNKPLPSTIGRYTFQATYNGITCSSHFWINCGALSAPDVSDLAQIEVSPNPANNIVNIEGKGIDNGNYRFILRNVIGQTVMADNARVENNAVQKSFRISTIPNGIYFLEIATDKSKTVRKIIKQN
jgi:peptidase M23-like protein/type IX secretion system substrate protein